MRISDWSSDVCSSDLRSVARALVAIVNALPGGAGGEGGVRAAIFGDHRGAVGVGGAQQQEGDEDRQQGAERDQDALASQQRAARRWRLKLIIVDHPALPRSEEHTSELQSLMRISYDGFCLKKTTT